MKNDTIYQMVTDRIIALLDAGEIPWHKNWNGLTPKNLVSRRPYHGINFLLLEIQSYSSPYWLTFLQVKRLGGYVKKGERGTPVVYWKLLKRKEQTESEDEEESTIPLLRYYTVFNFEQCADIKSPPVERMTNRPIERCEAVLKRYSDCPEIRPDLARAFYSPGNDHIGMPALRQFLSPEAYYATLFHELIHSTGHERRLNRKPLTAHYSFGSPEYSNEELIAEMGAGFLSALTGIDNAAVTKNNAGYIQGWLKRLQDDRRLVIKAASQAQKAVDYILGNL